MLINGGIENFAKCYEHKKSAEKETSDGRQRVRFARRILRRAAISFEGSASQFSFFAQG